MRGHRLAAPRRLLAVLALLALAWQSLIVQTHVHPHAPAASIAGAAANVPLLGTHHHGPRSDVDGCALCAAAHQVDVLLPPAVALPVAVAAAPDQQPTIAPSLAIRTRSHDWRGRGPPLG